MFEINPHPYYSKIGMWMQKHEQKMCEEMRFLAAAAASHNYAELMERAGSRAKKIPDVSILATSPLTRESLHESPVDGIGENGNRDLQRSLGSGIPTPKRYATMSLTSSGEHLHEKSMLNEIGLPNLKNVGVRSYHYTQEQDRHACTKLLNSARVRFCIAVPGRLEVVGFDGTNQLPGLTPEMVWRVALDNLEITYIHFKENRDVVDLTKHGADHIFQSATRGVQLAKSNGALSEHLAMLL
jgi:hypothetical protein